MYIIKKQEPFSDTLKLQKMDGETLKYSEEIKFSLNITPETIKKYRKIQIDLATLQENHKKNPESYDLILEKIGETIISLFTLLFGEENKTKILSFYENDYINMLTDILPYIQNVIAPQMKKTVMQIQKNAKHKFR